MSHKVKKDEAQRLKRGEMWIGFRPHREATKQERIKKSQQKHKKLLTNDD